MCWRRRRSAEWREARTLVPKVFHSLSLAATDGWHCGSCTRTYAPRFLGAVSQQPAAAGCPWFTRSIFNYMAFAAIRALRFVAQASLISKYK